MVHFFGHKKKFLEESHRVEDNVLLNDNISLLKVITMFLTHTALLIMDKLCIKHFVSPKSELLGRQINLFSLTGTHLGTMSR